MAELFYEDKDIVFLYGQEKYFEKENTKFYVCNNIEECIENSDIVISAVPLSKDGITINSPYSKEVIRLDTLYHNLGQKMFIAGGIPTWFYENRKIQNMDVLQLEELTILNAIPTVEGTIKIAIEESEKTIHESNVLVYGFGRIGKILCEKFQGLGANVYCVSRRESDFAWIKEKRYEPVTYEQVESKIKRMDIIINTVPSKVIEKKQIEKVRQDSVIIDIASSPGGVDKEAAKEYKIKVITALGLPGKVAPKTAAKYIKTIIDKRIK